MTIDKGKRDTEIECLYKMGEACEIAKKLNLPISFSAQKGPDGSLKIEFLQYEEDEKMEKPNDLEPGQVPYNPKPRKRDITMKEFYREYRKLKRIQNSVKNNFFVSHETQGAQGKPPNIS